MRISEYYELNQTQPSLDFVDVDIIGDLPVFIDPRALRRLPSSWADECVSLIQHFFSTVLCAIRDGRNEDARRLLLALREPNETHLGLSRGRARGRALGEESAHDVWQALSRSEAVISGLLQDLEETILMIEGVGPDIVSDITSNIIREPLIHYTQDMCRYHGIPLVDDVASGSLWDPRGARWYTDYVQLPVAKGNRLLLVPKVIVRRRMDYEFDEYYRHYILEHLREQELAANTELVHLLKDGRPRVYKKDLEAKYGRSKQMVTRVTLRAPDILRRYRGDKVIVSPPLTHKQLADEEASAPPDWDGLLNAVTVLQPGRPDADRYERAIEQLLTALFYPALSNPQRQVEIHEGRKRIDITYTNSANDGFFNWLGRHYPSANIFVECKNYQSDVGNPELDQLAGRFSPNRGRFGLLVCRAFDDKDTFLKRCRDTAGDARGFMIPLDDSDLTMLVAERRDNYETINFSVFYERMRIITS